MLHITYLCSQSKRNFIVAYGFHFVVSNEALSLLSTLWSCDIILWNFFLSFIVSFLIWRLLITAYVGHWLLNCDVIIRDILMQNLSLPKQKPWLTKIKWRSRS